MEDLKKYLDDMMKPYHDILKRNEQIFNQVRIATEPVKKWQEENESLNTKIRKAIEPVKNLQKGIEIAVEPFVELQKTFENIYKIQSSALNLIPTYPETFRILGERLKEYARNVPKFLLIIAEYGWFIEICEFNLPVKVVRMIEECDVDKADQILVEYYENNIDRIFDELCSRHPKRRDILTQIRKAFKEENHFLLIPCVLSQVDGISFDFTKRKFFIKDKNNDYLPEVSSVIEKSTPDFLNIYLSPLMHKTPIMAHKDDINKFPCHLNRNEILHGVNVSYGEKINSLKVISLLKYISDILILIDKDE